VDNKKKSNKTDFKEVIIPEFAGVIVCAKSIGRVHWTLILTGYSLLY